MERTEKRLIWRQRNLASAGTGEAPPAYPCPPAKAAPQPYPPQTGRLWHTRPLPLPFRFFFLPVSPGVSPVPAFGHRPGSLQEELQTRQPRAPGRSQAARAGKALYAPRAQALPASQPPAPARTARQGRLRQGCRMHPEPALGGRPRKPHPPPGHRGSARWRSPFSSARYIETTQLPVQKQAQP